MAIRTNLSEGWTLRLAADADHAEVPAEVRARLPIRATVPGTVHMDLLAEGLIPDPYLDRNELILGRIGRVPWVCERELRYPVLDREEVVLAFEVLDTIATVSVNGVVRATTENKHRRYEVPLTAVLHNGQKSGSEISAGLCRSTRAARTGDWASRSARRTPGPR